MKTFQIPHQVERMRHYFRVLLPEELQGTEPTHEAWMDISIIDKGTVGEKWQVDDFGVVFDGININRPQWITVQERASQIQKIQAQMKITK